MDRLDLPFSLGPSTSGPVVGSEPRDVLLLPPTHCHVHGQPLSVILGPYFTHGPGFSGTTVDCPPLRVSSFYLWVIRVVTVPQRIVKRNIKFYGCNIKRRSVLTENDQLYLFYSTKRVIHIITLRKQSTKKTDSFRP